MDTRPFCCRCNTRLHCQKNEVAIKYGGNEHRPSILWDAVLLGDLWRCPECGYQMVTGWACRPWYPKSEADAAYILQIAQAIEASGQNWVALDAVELKSAPP